MTVVPSAPPLGIPPLRLTVSQVRLAAACPRMAYFDADHTRRHQRRHRSATRLWKRIDDQGVVGLGSLFHAAVERFQQKAPQEKLLAGWVLDADSVDAIAQAVLMHVYRTHLSRRRLERAAGNQQQAFMLALRRYVFELAEILWYGRQSGVAVAEMVDQMFGDQRRLVDVSFAVGPSGRRVNVHGRLDFVFFDWRSGRRRIIDYKLMPPDQPEKDLAQIGLYALMHDVQHGTQPDAAVLYLHPRRIMLERSWREIDGRRRETYRLVASLRDWLEFDEETETGLKPPGDEAYCATCPWRRECVSRLGPKSEGDFLPLEQISPTPTPTPTPRPQLTRASSPDMAPFASPDVSTPGVTAPVGGMVSDAVPIGSASDPHAENHADARVAPHGELPASEFGAPIVTPPRLDNVMTPRELCLGTWQNDSTTVRMGVDALTMHAIVAGAAGSGKTWTAKVLLEEAIRCEVPVIAVDPQGDLVQLHRLVSGAEPLDPRWEPMRREFLARREVRVWTPGSRIGLPMALDPLRLSAKPGALAPLENGTVDEVQQQVLSSAAANLVSLAQAGGESESQQTLLMLIMRRLLKRAPQQVSLSAVIDALRDPTLVGIDDADHVLRRTERQKLARMLNNLQQGPAAPLFGRGVPLDVDTLVTPFEPGKTPLNVIYLNHLTDDRQKQFLVSVLANEVYRWMQTRDPANAGRLVLYLDEARDFLPAGTKLTPAKIPLRRLFSQGRKYGVACVAAAQSPRSVEYEALSNCSTKLIGRLESQQDVERVREWFSRETGAPEWLAGRKGAPAGSFVGRWPGLDAAREGASFTSRPLFSLHQGAWSPDRVEQELASDPWRLRVIQASNAAE